MTLTELQQDVVRKIDAALRDLENLSIEWGDISLQESCAHLLVDWEQAMERKEGLQWNKNL